MGYDIFAVGVIKQPSGQPYRYPNYDKTDRYWGDEWEMDKMLDLALSMRGVNTGGSLSGGLTIDAMKMMADWQFRRIMGQTLTFLALDAEGEISIYTRNQNMLMPDTVDFATFKFDRRRLSSAYEAMLKHMKKVELNKMGPMMDMIYCLSEWAGKGKKGDYNFRFDFTWS